MSSSLKVFLYFTAAGIFAYWILVIVGVFPVDDLVPGYKNWFMSFPVADGWIAIASILAATLCKSNKRLSAIFTSAAGSGLIFLGLYAFAYGFNTGLVYHLTFDEGIEIAIKVYCLSIGSWFIASGYQQTLEHTLLERQVG